MRIGKCRGCGAPIVWIKTLGGKPMPCDPDQVLYRARAGAPGKIVTPNGDVLSCDLDADPEEATGSDTSLISVPAHRRKDSGGTDHGTHDTEAGERN